MALSHGRMLASVFSLFICFMIPARVATGAGAVQPILVGLDADMSASAATGGEAIRRGALIAIDEVNRSGGIIGRPLELVVRDHRGNPDRGIDNINDLAAMDDLVAVIGGIHTPVAMAELEAIHENQLLYLGPWAAGTGIVDNGYDPNFVFRVSVRDEHAGEFLIDATLERGHRRPAFLLWQTAWGRSNEIAMTAALERRGMEPAAVEWFNTGAKSLSTQLDSIRDAGADSLMLIAAPDGAATFFREMAGRPVEERLPIIAHWGFTSGDFDKILGKEVGEINLVFLQTFSFFNPPFPDRAEQVLAQYCKQFEACDGPAAVEAPAGMAHAYDLVHLLALAVDDAGTTDRQKVRRAMELLERHRGLVRTYDPPFTPARHDALDQSDFRLATYDEIGKIVPAPKP
ncbi:MAG: ABC transporter substrate-binding protein [Geminicoccaceae bacterium]